MGGNTKFYTKVCKQKQKVSLDEIIGSRWLVKFCGTL